MRVYALRVHVRVYALRVRLRVYVRVYALLPESLDAHGVTSVLPACGQEITLVPLFSYLAPVFTHKA